MNLRNTVDRGTARHRAEDDLFHYDRSRMPGTTECITDLFRSPMSARDWVVGMRPRWLVSASQPLLRPRSDR